MTTQATHQNGNITALSAEIIPTKYLFGTLKDNKAHTAPQQLPLAVITDSASSPNQPINLQILGSNASTMKVSAGSIINPGDMITPDANATASSTHNLKPGTYHVAGIAISHAQPGELVEFTPTLGLITEIK